MKIEAGTQPNCSELVLRLYYPTINKRVLRELERITDWRAGIMIRKKNSMFAMPIDLQKVKVTDSSFRVDYEDIIDERMLYYMLKFDISPRDLRAWCEDYADVKLIPYRRFVHNEYLKLGIDIRIVSENIIEMDAAQHCYTPHFSPLLRILQAKDDAQWYVSDGGRPDEFLKWCAQRGQEDLASATYIDKAWLEEYKERKNR